MKRRLAFLALLVSLLAMWATSVYAYNNGIGTNPSIIDPPGGSTTITLETTAAATGTLSVTAPDGHTIWTISVNQPAGPKNYVFPDDFLATNPSANTTAIGSYDVEADIAILGYTDHATFTVEFFSVPVTPLGIVGILGACFAALGVKRIKKTQ
jgi:hypothetical protein